MFSFPNGRAAKVRRLWICSCFGKRHFLLIWGFVDGLALCEMLFGQLFSSFKRKFCGPRGFAVLFVGSGHCRRFSDYTVFIKAINDHKTVLASNPCASNIYLSEGCNKSGIAYAVFYFRKYLVHLAVQRHYSTKFTLQAAAHVNWSLHQVLYVLYEVNVEYCSTNGRIWRISCKFLHHT